MSNGCFGLDSTGDMSLDANGNLFAVYDTKSIIQNVTSAIRLWFGEYEFNTKIGIKYKRYLGENPSLIAKFLRADIIKAIQSVTGVVKVLSLQYDYNTSNNTFTGTAVISLSNGATLPPIGF